MAMLLVHVCNAITGAPIDRIPVSAYSYSRLLSAGDSGGSVTIPLDGTISKAQVRSLASPWSRLMLIERDGAVEYIGYSQGSTYTRGSQTLTVKLADIWALFNRRGAWDHTAGNVELWKETVVGNRAYQAASAIERGRNGPALPAMGLPLTLPGGYAGPSVTRTYYGYNVETVGDVLADLLAEGLDIYFRPRWSGGQADWLFQAASDWSSGAVREFVVSAKNSPVTGFSETSDAARVTNNARYIGEGSEVDMLVRSERNVASPYPLLDRVTNTKHISNVAQLSSLSAQDLVSYGSPTVQWDFSVSADTPVDVGDTARLHFDGDPWVIDGWYNRRVVKVSGDQSDQKKISVQPTGGA
ncbi:MULTISPECIES: hypothetical protein [unclassified Microbacterium]|uniref:hypothetical protein n=1 Tax=unclassified Microbacterium TaxID=2609290 RepID=UPI00109C4079|nr:MULTISPECIES: hypothetical protein [unclassified Microbacterium]